MNAERARPGLLFLLLNVRGLTGCKLVQLISWLKEKRVDVAVFTETHLSSSPEDLLRRLPGAGALWPGVRIHSCPGTGHTEGITVVLSPRCNALSPALFQDIQGGGRLLRIDFTIEDQLNALVEVYGPAQADLRRGVYRHAVRAVLLTAAPGRRLEVRAQTTASMPQVPQPRRPTREARNEERLSRRRWGRPAPGSPSCRWGTSPYAPSSG